MMPKPIWQLGLGGSLVMVLLSGCTLVDLSGLQGGAGGRGSPTTSSGALTGAQGGAAPCGPDSCSMHGHCEVASCVCDGHFDGPTCGACAMGYVGADCLGCAPGFQDANDDGTCLPSCTSTTCSGNGTCDDTSGTAICACSFGFDGSDCAVVCPSQSGGTDCAFHIVYGLDMPTISNWLVPSDVPYDIDKSASIGTFSRVGYRFVLDLEEVWVEMDAFTVDASKLGVPVAWTWNRSVDNARVLSWSPNRASSTTPMQGRLEFWSDCYSEGPDGVFDETDLDEPAQPHCYGSMQVSVGGLNVFSFNAWEKNDFADVGIGRAMSGSLDWTFAANAAAFSKRRLEVYARP